MSCVDLTPEEVLNKLKSEEAAKIFSDNGVLAAYLFGSMASSSDVDVAVVFQNSFKDYEYGNFQSSIDIALGELLETNEIEVLVLNNAHPVEMFRVLRKRAIIFCANEHDRAEFEILAFSLYYDHAYVVEHQPELVGKPYNTLE